MEGANDSDSDENDEQVPEFLQELPEDAIMYMEDLEIDDRQARQHVQQAGDRIHVVEPCCFASPEVKPSRCIVEALAQVDASLGRPESRHLRQGRVQSTRILKVKGLTGLSL